MKVISIASGKGGVGKTTVCVNLGCEMVRLGYKVIILDCDLGLANVCLSLGLEPEKTMEDFIFDDVPLAEVLIDAPGGLKIIPGASGSKRLTSIDTAQKQALLSEARGLAADYDFLLIDTAAGISENVLFFLHSSDTVLALISGEPTAMADGYALFKVLIDGGCPVPHLLLNRCASFWEAKRIAGKIRLAVKKFLERRMPYVGYIRNDKLILSASRTQKLLVKEYPSSRSAYDFYRTAMSVCGQKRGFFSKISDIFH